MKREMKDCRHLLTELRSRPNKHKYISPVDINFHGYTNASGHGCIVVWTTLYATSQDKVVCQ